jgi:putative exporter of polyketide antibiotics
MPGTLWWSLMLVLFFFWAYGVVSFGLDLKNTIIPGVIKYRRGRRRQKAQKQREEEREEREQQLY